MLKEVISMRKLFLSLCILFLTCQFALALEVTQITFEGDGLINPVLAPGNKLVAYCQNQNGKNVIYTKPFSPEKGTSQTGARKLYETYNQIAELQWAPTGNWLAFIESSRQNGPGTLTSLTLDGKTKQLIEAAELFAINTAGTQLVYQQGRDLHILDLRSSTSRKIISGDFLSQITSLHWRRDGVITFARKRLLSYPQLWASDSSGRQSLLFTLNGHSTIASHSWSTNGERLVYKDASSNISTLWSANKNGDNRLMLASGQMELVGWYGPDAFFFAQKDARGRSQIWLAKVTDPAPQKPDPIKPDPPRPEPPRPLPGQERVYYTQGFDKEQSWSSYPGARDRVKKGVYEIKLDRKNQGLKYLAPITIPHQDFTVEVELENQKKEGKAGLIFNYLDDRNFYLFQVDPTSHTYSLMRLESNRWYTLIRETKLSSLSQKGTHKLTVRQQGRRLDLYLGSQYLGGVNINQPPKNTKAGLWIASGQKTPVEFAFDNFKITLSGTYVEPQPKVLFSDNFSNSRGGWPTGNYQGTSASYRSGEYWLRINQPNTGYSYLAPTRVPTASYQLEVDLKFDSRYPGEAGLVFNVTAGDNFSLFTLNPQNRTWAVYKYQYGRKETIAQGSRLALSGNTNRLKIVQANNNLEVYLNNKYLTRKTHAAPQSCQVGLMLSSGSKVPLDAYFDNFVVTAVGNQSPNQEPWNLFFSPMQSNLSPIFELSTESPQSQTLAIAPALLATPAVVTTPQATPQLAGLWYPAEPQPRTKRATASFSAHVPLGGSLPLTTQGGGKTIYALLTDDDWNEYAFSAEQKDSAEASPSLLLPMSLNLPLSYGDFFKISLGFSLRGFENPLLISNEFAPAGGYLLNMASSINLSLPLGDYLELFGGIGLGKYLINCQNKLEKAGTGDEGYNDGERIHPPGTTINLSGWSSFGGTTSLGVRFKLTPNLSIEGQYSSLPGGTISSYKYSLGSVFAKGIETTDYPKPISIQGQSCLSLGASFHF